MASWTFQSPLVMLLRKVVRCLRLDLQNLKDDADVVVGATPHFRLREMLNKIANRSLGHFYLTMECNCFSTNTVPVLHWRRLKTLPQTDIHEPFSVVGDLVTGERLGKTDTPEYGEGRLVVEVLAMKEEEEEEEEEEEAVT
ncbi:Hypothetical Protein FCC1311_020572 [Hondaea fermentalgiana]|uniref:Uncharacterized protein n=1 Tax=Hondaea fermentalgiana TaxID=2315210 RepID=A0A2R5G7R1_9STRA|nr:Hypothetical Protein FCC1311_020572 [Hondaea fermentalgiana]|eukprot:GBG25838.1 Hypothetical Protein FCC1311_020572 [Hondaea fermentalgiana]